MTYRQFRKDARGSTAIIFGVALIPIMGLLGAAVDYSRASSLKSRLTAAADAAALAGSKERNLAFSQREQIARKVFEANTADLGLKDIKLTITQLTSGMRVGAETDQGNLVMGVIGIKKTKVNVIAEAQFSVGRAEIALVLDNTGSMKNDMANLKEASQKFIDLIMLSGPNDQAKMSIVPFNAAVNVGSINLPLSMMDTGASSKWHAQILEGQTIAEMIGCNPNPFPPPPSSGGGSDSGGGGGGGGGGPPPKQGPSSSDKAWLYEPLKSFASLATELFGISAARADITPPTSTPFMPGAYVEPALDPAYGPAYAPAGTKAWVPQGFVWAKPCSLQNPAKISHFDLFNRIPGARWKGCVEARPEPYDVTDVAPSLGNPDTLFVPYFWPDEPGEKGKKSVFANNYMSDDGVRPSGWQKSDEAGDLANLFKYNGTNSATIQEIGPNTMGPNAACPDELVRLTQDKIVLKQKIDSLSHWFGGGTVVSEGVMWGWRTLSPNLPFGDGDQYANIKKFMVVMTDGANTLEDNNLYGPTISDYSAYGYIANGRFGSEDYPVVEAYLDNRVRLACENVKKTGIRVYTVLYREVAKNAVDSMRNCATEAKNFYQVKNGNELDTAFTEIANEITRLRLTK